MREIFFKALHSEMQKNKSIFFITADMGYGLADQIKKDFHDRFFNVQAAEQAMLDICVGLALGGKIPFAYSITPFLLCRGFETIRNYIDHENIPVKLIGSGRDKDYEHQGFSHDASDDEIIMNCFKNIIPLWPTKENIKEVVSDAINCNQPVYINLKR